MSSIILFGGSGFLGPIILEKYPEIISIGRTPLPSHLKNRHIQINNLDTLSKLDNIDFDKVIFLIGSSDHHEINISDTMGIDFNVYPIKKVLNYLSKRKIRKFICFTTILLYDENFITLPVDETQKINPLVNDYVFSKYLSEKVVDFYSKRIPSIIVRLSNIYGPTNLIRPDLVPTLIQKILSKKKIVSVWNDLPKRDFVYAFDAADAIIKLINSEFVGTVNLGSGNSVSIREICNYLEELSEKKIISEGKNVSGPMEFTTDISLLQKTINWKPDTDIKSGLKQTYDIMKSYLNSN